MPSKTDEIRAYVLEQHVRPWRLSCPTDLTVMMRRETGADDFTECRLRHTSGGMEETHEAR